MTITIRFSEGLAERLGTPGTYVSVEGAVTVDEVVSSLATEFEADGLLADAVAVRESAVAAEPLGPRASVAPGDRLRFEPGARAVHA